MPQMYYMEKYCINSKNMIDWKMLTILLKLQHETSAECRVKLRWIAEKRMTEWGIGVVLI